MKICEILSVGTELLLGDVVDTNAAYLSREMRSLGIFVYHKQTCGDHAQRLASALTLALSRADLVIVTGGLGPTYDDLTRETVGHVLSRKLYLHQETAERIAGYFFRRGMKMPENNLRQAMVPEGAEILTNEWGTAPGLWLREGEKSVILLPGVPSEMKMLFSHCVAPRLRAESEGVLLTRILRFWGISESALDEALGEMMREGRDPTIAPYAGQGEVALHLTASGKTEVEALDKIAAGKDKILSLVGEWCYGEEDAVLEKVLVERFSQKGLTLAVAESCTGGLLAERITSVSGASAVFGLGVVTYTEEMKKNLLHVPAEVLDTYGVYSKETALAMAEGVRRQSGATLGIGISGIAGPTGGTETDPVGTVYLALTDGKKEVVERCVLGHASSDRQKIRSLAASRALALALQHQGLFSLPWKKI